MKNYKKFEIVSITILISFVILALMGCFIYFIVKGNNGDTAEDAEQYRLEQTPGGESENTLEQLAGNITVSNSFQNNILNEATAANAQAESNQIEHNYKELTAKLAEEEIFKIDSYEKKNEAFILKGQVYKPAEVSLQELQSIILAGKVQVYGADYVIKYNNGVYELYSSKYDMKHYYFDKKDDNTYYLKSYTEYPTIWSPVDDYKQITVDANTKCVYSENSYTEKTNTVNNVFSKKMYFNGYFKFTFENGKCIEVREVVIGH